MMHGLDDSADCWVMNSNKSPAFIAAREGYDVWLGNWRGNKYSRRHKTLDPDRDEKVFFNYSFIEMSRFDLRAMVDKVLECTKASKLAYIGHSMGTTVMFYAMTTEPDYIKKKISLFVALGPVAKLKNCNSNFIRKLSEVRAYA
jgi:pimeloyl-ACP methyl ester carboxylesterase